MTGLKWTILGIFAVCTALAHAANMKDRTKSVSPRPVVHFWKVADLKSDLNRLDSGRDFAQGERVFREANCAMCHRLGEAGARLPIAPDLGETAKKLADGKITREKLLRDILEPSAEIDLRYAPRVVYLKDGSLVTGLILKKDQTSLTMVVHPQQPLRKVQNRDIESISRGKLSMMPPALLATFSREEILDLLAYIVSGGDRNHPAFRRK